MVNNFGVFNLEYHHILFQYIVEKYGMNLKDERNKKADDIVSSFTNLSASFSIRTNSKAVEFIELLQKELEDQMKKIIETKSIYYWFHLYRRIAPMASFNNESNQTVFLYRNILENAFLKYGKKEAENELIYGTDRRPVKVQDIANGLYAEALEYYGIKMLFVFVAYIWAILEKMNF